MSECCWAYQACSFPLAWGDVSPTKSMHPTASWSVQPFLHGRFSHICQVAPMSNPCNTCFVGPVLMVQPFLHSSLQNVPLLYNGLPLPQNCPFHGGSGPPSTMWFVEPALANSPSTSVVSLLYLTFAFWLYTAVCGIMSVVLFMFRICPIFAISCVNGRNLDLLLKFLNALPPLSNGSEREKIVQALTEHQASWSQTFIWSLFYIVSKLSFS